MSAAVQAAVAVACWSVLVYIAWRWLDRELTHQDRHIDRSA
jgi:hypothetical protein